MKRNMTKSQVYRSTWQNPRWYGKWRIYLDPSPFGSYAFVHDDYDGAPDAHDNRCGHGRTLQDCITQIDEIEADA